MYFEDNFNYTQQEVNNIALMAFLMRIKKVIDKGKNTINGNVLIEGALKKLDVSTFDFINDESIMKINEGLTYALKCLIEEGLLSSIVQPKDKFYKFFISKQLFSSSDFSSKFEEDLVLSLLYKLDFSFKYLISNEFLTFYKTYLTHTYIKSAKKIITVNLKKYLPIKILVLPKKVTQKYLIKAIENYNYSNVCDFISYYDNAKNFVSLFATKKDTDSQLISDLTITVNVEDKLKEEFKV